MEKISQNEKRRMKDMYNMNVTKNVTKYIYDNNISIERVAKDTRVSMAKLNGDSREKLSATEFLSVCAYLNVDPLRFEGNIEND